jgi:hypothetical protein
LMAGTGVSERKVKSKLGEKLMKSMGWDQ